ncbi:putative DUF4229 family protein [Actinoalloteichus hymeniacidonis]|uniref:DUF4229 family protein n=1 Tax=Actinoalloteichus hymeniacidonis TaxID=340345 RepID=A0AAC9MWJ0_9PSEU|nr:putative DUF4229 family protein [Actinoalloteichus hymeniacidonis]
MAGRVTDEAETPQDAAPARKSRLAVDLTIYTAARLLAVAVPAGLLIMIDTPVLVAFAVALVLGLGLSLVLLRPLRAKVAVGIDEYTARRRAARQELEAQLRGEDRPRGSSAP